MSRLRFKGGRAHLDTYLYPEDCLHQHIAFRTQLEGEMDPIGEAIGVAG